ncbi:MAG: lipid-A-disaccharide synthase [Proteobacteria bacterium]|nr:lipid-A-disaccharide synthase [Pseudomonadota bacterium]
MIHVGIVAGESSGDQLGGTLVTALRQAHPDIRITGMAGPKMVAAGCEAIANVDELSVMGIVEVLRKYPQLLRLRARISAFYLDNRPDVFVGIDVPDFVMGIEARLFAENIKTVHYVAPQIWAWRQSRAKKIAKRLDLLLALFPFEVPFYERYGVNTTFVGHPLADLFPITRDRERARLALKLDTSRTYIALMPGSRRQEWIRHGDLFLKTAKLAANQHRDTAFLVAAINADAREYIDRRAREICPGLEIDVRVDHSHEILRASDVVLCASGTTTMEGLFAKTPMVVAYKLSPITHFIMKRMVKVPYIAMPNLLAGATLVPEYLQDEARPETLAKALSAWIDDPNKVQDFQRTCTDLHKSLRRGAAERAAFEILRLAGAIA